MKNLKKFLALLLALCMLTSMLGTAAFAAGEEEEDATETVVCTKAEDCAAETHEEGCPLHVAPENDPEPTEEQPEETEAEPTATPEPTEEPELCEHEWDEGKAVEGGTKYTCALCGESHVLEKDDSFETDTLEEIGDNNGEPEPQAEQTETENVTGYAGAALPAGPDMNGDTVTVTPENAQYTLDGAYGSINGKTIEFTGEYTDILYVNRPSKYPDSGTVYYNGYSNRTQVDSASDLKQTGVTSYTRDLNNVTLTAAAGVVIPGIQVYGCGHHHDAGNTGTAKDPVREIPLQTTNTSFYFNYKLDGLTFDGLTIQNQVEFPMWDDSAQEDGAGKNITFKNCTFLGDEDQMSSLQAVKAVATRQNYNNLTVEDCTFTNYFQGVYTGNVSTGTFKDNSFTNLTHNAIALQNGANMTVGGRIEISGNTFTNVSDRCIRFGNIGENAEIVVSNNTAINSGDDADEIMKAGTIAPTTSITIAADNNWGEGKTVNAGMLPAAEVNGESYLTLQAAIDAADGKTVTLLKDIYLEATVNVGAEITTTLDLNGYKITVKQTNGKSLYAIDNYGTLTIDDTSEGKNGKIIARGTGNYGTMYMKGGAIESCDSNGGGAAVWNEGTFEMTGGTLAFTGEKSGNNAGAPFNNAAADATAKITGGKLVSPLTCMFVNSGAATVENISVENSTSYWMAFKVLRGGELTLKNVTVNSKDGGCVEAAGGTVNLEGCTFNQSPKTDVAGEGHTSSTVAVSGGGTVNVKSGNYTSAGFGAYVYNSGGTINIEDGTFTAAEAALKADDSQYVNSPSAIKVEGGSFEGACIIGSESTLAVSGGTFNTDVKDYVVEGMKQDPSGQVVAGTDGPSFGDVAAIGNVGYTTLQEAVADAADGQTVTLVKSASGSGIIINKNITIDFGGNTYTVGKAPLAGSAGTATQGFQILAGADKANPNTVTMVNGQIVLPSTTENLYMGIQNYADLTLDGITIDASDNSNISYVLSNNNGVTTITGGTVLRAAEGKVAFDVYDYSAGGYGNVTVRVVDAASPCPQVEIVGKIEVSDSDKATLAISGGKYTTELKADWCAEGFLPVRNTDGTYGVAAIPTVPTTYRVSVTAGEGGSVSASRRSAARGATVAVTVTPDEGYELSEITAVTAAGRNVTLSGSDGSYTFTMPSAAVTVTVTFAEAENLEDPDTPLAGALPFEDVTRNDWYFGAISSVYLKELMVGINGTEFGPEMPSNRGTVATILHRMENTPDAEMGDFTDVLAGQWYAPAISWANQTGVMIGYDTGVFQPEGGITREQLALTFYRYYTKVKGGTAETRADLSTFADGEQVSGWAREAMEWAVGCGLLKGTTENCLAPQGATKRSELAAVLQRFLEMK